MMIIESLVFRAILVGHLAFYEDADLQESAEDGSDGVGQASH
jgi:hypothetical protein